MGQTSAYLDYNATAPIRDAVIAAVADAMRVTGNPSSIHSAGRAARKLVEEARRDVAALVGAEPATVTFTSGGTEANALALGRPDRTGTLLACAVEHPSVLGGGRYPADSIVRLPVDADGVLRLDPLEQALSRTAGPALVSVMLANNETGAIQPVADAARIAHAAGARIHCDAVQAAGRLEIDIAGLDVDYLTLSGHKLGGPQGTGALVRRSRDVPVHPLYAGGGQERSHRPGTEAIAGIAGFGAAARLAAAEVGRQDEIRLLRDWLESELRTISTDTVIFSDAVERLANTSCFAVPGIPAETAMISLDLDGVCVSSGSACSSGKVGRSHVLDAMGVSPDLASGAIRASLGLPTKKLDVERFIGAWRRVVTAREARLGREFETA